MDKYTIYGLLPLVKLRHDDAIDMGPVKFGKASKYHDYLEPEYHKVFEDYIKHSYADFWARVNEKDAVKDIPIKTIPIEEMTYIALDDYKCALLNEKQKGELILDSIHFLCFLTNIGVVRNRAFAIANNLKPFIEAKKISVDILKNKPNWARQSWYTYIGKEAEVFTLNNNLLHCFGKILMSKIFSINSRWARHIIRAVQYYDRIFIGLDYGSIIYYGSLPEDVVFLSMAFESLLDVHFASAEKKYTLDKIKHIMQNAFNIKYDAPKNVLIKWVQEFYDLRSRIVHGDEIPDQIFHGNENIDIPYINLGMKIFVAALVCELSSHACLEPNLRQQETEYIEDFYIYLWPQIPLLDTIKNILFNISEKTKQNEDVLKDVIELDDLEEICLSVYFNENSHGFKIKSSNESELKRIIDQIIYIAERKIIYKDNELRVMDLDHMKQLSKTDEFINLLKSQGVSS